MFISVILDPSGPDTARLLAKIMVNYGLKKSQRACWESTSISQNQFESLKEQIDMVTDYYDCVRIYQFPVKECFAVTELKHKIWRQGLLSSAKEK